MPEHDDDEEYDLDLSEADPSAEVEPVDWEDAARELIPRPQPTPVDGRLVSVIRKHMILNAQQLAQLPPIEWFIEDVFPLGAQTVLHGKGGTYKSFLLLDWMLHADQGMQWHGRNLRPGKCLYIAGEGARGVTKRLFAWCAHHGIHHADIGVVFMADPVNLFSASDEAVTLLHEVVRLGNFDYVVVDTLHTVSGGAEENSSKDMGIVFNKAKRLAGDASLFFIHHDPKDGKKTARGSSSIRDDSDVVVMIEHDDTDYSAVLKPDKIRDGESFKPLHFHLAKASPPGGDISLVIDSVTGSVDELAEAQGQRLINAIIDHPGMGSKALREALNLSGASFKARTDPLLASGKLVTMRGDKNALLWYVAGDEPGEDE